MMAALDGVNQSRQLVRVIPEKRAELEATHKIPLFPVPLPRASTLELREALVGRLGRSGRC